MWHYSKYDLINFTTARASRLRERVKKIKAMASTLNFSAAEMIDRAKDGAMTEEQLVKEGPLLTIKWASVQEEQKHDETKGKPAQGGGEWGDNNLEGVPWGKKHIWELLAETDEDMIRKACPRARRTSWMDEKIVESTLAQLEQADVEKLSAGLGIGKGNAEEDDEMDMEN